MTEIVSPKLDAVELLPVGSGKLDLFSFLQADPFGARAGVGVDYAHRVRRNLALFGQATGAVEWTRETGRRTAAEVIGGLRWRL